MVLDLPEYLLRDLECPVEGSAQDPWRGDRRIQHLDGIAVDAGLHRAKVPLSAAGSGRRIAADVPDRLAAAGRSRLRDPGRSGAAGESRGIAPRLGARSAGLV